MIEGAIIAVLALAAVTLAIRAGGLRAELSTAKVARYTAQEAAEDAELELEELRGRTARQLEDLRHDIADLENHFAACSAPDDLRDRLERLFAQAAAGHGDDGGSVVSGAGGRAAEDAGRTRD